MKNRGAFCFGGNCERNQRIEQVSFSQVKMSNLPMKSTQVSVKEKEKINIEMLRSILERRLRFVVSEEFRGAKKSEEKEKKKAASKKARSQSNTRSKAGENHSMKSDCFESDGSSVSPAYASSLASAKEGRSERSMYNAFQSDGSSLASLTRERPEKVSHERSDIKSENSPTACKHASDDNSVDWWPDHVSPSLW